MWRVLNNYFILRKKGCMRTMCALGLFYSRGSKYISFKPWYFLFVLSLTKFIRCTYYTCILYILIYNWVEGTQKRVKIFKIVFSKPREIFDHSFFLIYIYIWVSIIFTGIFGLCNTIVYSFHLLFPFWKHLLYFY